MLAGFAVLSLLYYMNYTIPHGWISWLLSLPALTILFVTAVARLDDIGMDKVELQWQVRRLGLVMVASSAIVYSVAPFTIYPKWPSWITVGMTWGVALAWLTTPSLPPWYKYITGEYRKKKEK